MMVEKIAAVTHVLGEEKLAKGLAQHWWTHVLSGMGFPE
jgi:hypothetical protein